MNHIVIFGHSALDIDTIINFFDPTEYIPYQSAQFVLKTKYYTAPITISIYNEQHLLDYILNPISESSQSFSQSVSQASCAIVLFDITHPHGFALIQKLYTQSIHSLLVSVDAHLFLGCTSQSIDPNTSTISLITHQFWRSWQEFSLDNQMQLIILDQLNNKPINYSSLVSSSPQEFQQTQRANDNQTDKNDKEGDDDDEQFKPADLLELDPSEFGMKAVISAISCCSWPHMIRENAPSKYQPSTTDSTSAQSSSTSTSTNSTPSQTITKQVSGIRLLPTDHEYIFSETSLHEYHAFDEEIDLEHLDALITGDISDSDQDSTIDHNQTLDGNLDDSNQDEFEGAFDQVEALLPNDETTHPIPTDQIPSISTASNSTAKTKKSVTTKKSTAATKKDGAKKPASSGAKKRDPMSQLNMFEGLLGQAAMLRNNAQSGRVNDTQRRDRATQMMLQMAKEFSFFDDMDDMMMPNTMEDGGDMFTSFLSNDDLENLNLDDLEKFIEKTSINESQIAPHTPGENQ